MRLLTIAATLAMGALAWAGAPTTTPAKKAPIAAAVHKTSVPAAKPAVAKRFASGVTASAKRTAKSTPAPVVRTSWRTRQAAPSSDRYREIQEALVARGYLSADDANGAWGATSIDAMKKFQAEQTLQTTGKIDSLSLIALGLGPRHDSAETIQRAVDSNVQAEMGRN